MGSSSDSDPRSLDERKRRRMQSNRDSARRSRARKQQHLDELVHRIAHLTEENAQVAARIGGACACHAAVEAENTVLRTRLAELAERLAAVNTVLRAVRDAGGVPVDIPDLPPDPLFKPWRLPFPAHAAFASAETFVGV